MSYSNPRITMNDTTISMLTKISEGNPGAMSVCAKILTEGEKIDPDSHPMLTIMSLDTLDIYGSRIWQLYKNVCDSSLSNMLGLLRAVQLGYMTERELSGAIDGKPLSAESIQSYLAKVREFLPNFEIAPK